MAQQKETEPLLGGNRQDIKVSSKIPVAFPREFRQRETFTIIFNLVVGLGFYVGAGTILATGGEGSMILALLFLGLLIVAVSRNVVQMLRIWPIDMSLVIFVQTFMDPHLGIVIGWLSYLTYCCCFAVSAVITSTLVDILVISKTISVLIKVLTIAVPVALNLMDTRYFKLFQLGLAGVKAVVVVAIFSIMLHINPSVAQPPRKLVSKEDLVFPGTGLHEHFIGLIFAMYKLTATFIGVEALSLIASETKPRRAASHGHVEEQPTEPEECRTEDQFMRPTRCIHGAVLVIYFLNGWIVGENVETNTRLPHYDGRIDATLSAFITSARARSDILGVWVVVLLIIAGAATQVSTLFVASRALYGMSVICSGRHNGTNDIDEDSTRLDFMWSKLSRKSRYHVPQCSVLVSTLLPAILMLTQALRPDSMDRVLQVVLETGCTACLLVWMSQVIAALRFYILLRKKEWAFPGLPDYMLREVKNDFRYRTHCTVSLLAAITCLVVILGGHYASYQYNPNRAQSLSSVVMLFVLMLAYILTRLLYPFDTDRLFGVDLEDDDKVKRLMQSLNNARTRGFATISQPPIRKRNLFGIIDWDY